METIEKPWGTIVRPWQSQSAYLDEIQIRAGGYSSKHLHAENFNQFVVHRGILIIRQFAPDVLGRPLMESYLRSGDSITVKPGIIHQFQADTYVQAIELYWTSKQHRACTPDDIERFSENGVLRGFA